MFKRKLISSCYDSTCLRVQVHAKGKKISKDVDYDKVARRTPGFTGADLQVLHCQKGFCRCLTNDCMFSSASQCALLLEGGQCRHSLVCSRTSLSVRQSGVHHLDEVCAMRLLRACDSVKWACRT